MTAAIDLAAPGNYFILKEYKEAWPHWSRYAHRLESQSE